MVTGQFPGSGRLATSRSESSASAADPWKSRELLFVDALEIGKIARHDGEQIVVLADIKRQEMTDGEDATAFSKASSKSSFWLVRPI